MIQKTLNGGHIDRYGGITDPVMKEIADDLMGCFENSFINEIGEFIADSRANAYFILKDCKSLEDVDCKVIEWLSRDCCLTQPFKSKVRNEQYQLNMLMEVNEFLGTSLSPEDMLIIYRELGNAVNHNLTLKFVRSYYDMKVLE